MFTSWSWNYSVHCQLFHICPPLTATALFTNVVKTMHLQCSGNICSLSVFTSCSVGRRQRRLSCCAQLMLIMGADKPTVTHTIYFSFKAFSISKTYDKCEISGSTAVGSDERWKLRILNVQLYWTTQTIHSKSGNAGDISPPFLFIFRQILG